jgi:hypothetical protein
MALKIAPAKKFLLIVQPESRQAILGEKAVPIPLYVLEVSIVQKKISSICEIETFSL